MLPRLSVLLLLCVSYVVAGESDIRAVAKAQLEKHRLALVTVRLVLNVKANNKEQEAKLEVAGTVLDAAGLTLVSASAVDPAELMTAGYPARMAPKLEFEIKEAALLLDDGTEVEAAVVLKDRDLDLAFLKPREAGRKFAYLPLAPNDRTLQPTDEFFVLSRLSRFGNRQPVVRFGLLDARVKGPRTFYICSGDASVNNLGSVSFAADGAPVGVCAMRIAKEAAIEGGLPVQAAITRYAGAVVGQVLRPLGDLLEMVEQAKQAKVPPRATPPEKKDEPKKGAEKKEEPKKEAEK